MKRWDGVYARYVEEYAARDWCDERVRSVKRELSRWGDWLKDRSPKPKLEDIDTELITEYLRGRLRVKAVFAPSAVLLPLDRFPTIARCQPNHCRRSSPATEGYRIVSLSAFLESLLDNGRTRVSTFEELSADERAEARELLVRFQLDYRHTLPGEPPALDVEAALWAAERIYRACQFLVYRDLGEGLVREELSTPCPRPTNPETIYSVDLSMRFLPDLLRMTRQRSTNDPLGTALGQLAGDWPLSSVGMRWQDDGNPKSTPLASTTGLEMILADPCLRQIYADRILEHQDRSRLDDPRVRQAVRACWGMYPDLAPDLAAAVEALEQQGATE